MLCYTELVIPHRMVVRTEWFVSNVKDDILCLANISPDHHRCYRNICCLVRTLWWWEMATEFNLCLLPAAFGYKQHYQVMFKAWFWMRCSSVAKCLPTRSEAQLRAPPAYKRKWSVFFSYSESYQSAKVCANRMIDRMAHLTCNNCAHTPELKPRMVLICALLTHLVLIRIYWVYDLTHALSFCEGSEC